MALPLYPVNYLAVVIAVILHIALGMFWYSDSGFGKCWRKSVGISDKQNQEMKKKGIKGMMKSMILGAIVAFVLISMLAQSIAGSPVNTLLESMEMAFRLWIGFIATTMMAAVLWEGKSWSYYYVNVFYWLISMLVSSIILFVWK